MATYYIDPVDGLEANNGTSELTPKKYWPGQTGATLTWGSNTYLQKKGTTAINDATMNLGVGGITIDSYGTGVNPIITRNIATYTGIVASTSIIYCNQNSVNFNNIDFNVINGFCLSIHAAFQQTKNFNITNCKFVCNQTNGSINARCLYLIDSASYALSNVNIVNCDFSGNGCEALIGSYPHQIQNYNWRIESCTFHDSDTAYGIHCIPSTTGSPNLYDITIKNNKFLNIGRSAISIDCGVSSGGLITKNTLDTIGNLSNAAVNAIQLSWVRNTIVSYNTIKNVTTSAPDGCGIIIDYGWVNNSYISSNNRIFGNDVSYCLLGDGIQAWKGSDNKVFSNIVHHCLNGISALNIQSSNNEFYNNLTYSNIQGGIAQKFNAATNTFRNNVSMNNGTDFYYENTAVSPVCSHNAYITKSASLVSTGTNNITTDPLLNLTDPVKPKLSRNSPCKYAGTATGQYLTDFRGRPFNNPPTIGPFEFTSRSKR